jgi:flagellar motor switch protein FliN/FliY
MAKATNATKEKPNQAKDAKKEDSKKKAQSVEFPEAVDSGPAGPGGSIDILLDMNVPITVAIGQTDISVRRLLQLGLGSVLKLDKSIDEPVDLCLKDIKFASGDVVVVDDRFAVRIKEVAGTTATADAAKA